MRLDKINCEDFQHSFPSSGLLGSSALYSKTFYASWLQASSYLIQIGTSLWKTDTYLQRHFRRSFVHCNILQKIQVFLGVKRWRNLFTCQKRRHLRIGYAKIQKYLWILLCIELIVYYCLCAKDSLMKSQVYNQTVWLLIIPDVIDLSIF